MKVIMPEFSSCKSFSAWVDLLEDKEIQSWTSKDWVNLYNTINQLLRKPKVQEEIINYYKEMTKKEIEQIEKEIIELEEKLKEIQKMKEKSSEEEFKKDCAAHEAKLKKTIESKIKAKEQKIKSITPKDEKTKETPLEKKIKQDRFYGTKYLLNQYRSIFYKLYPNYRLEPEIINYMIKIGKEIGHLLAHSHQIDTSVLALNIGKRKEYAEHISNTVFSYCFPFVAPEDATNVRHSIDIASINPDGSARWSDITISNRRADYFLETIFHELLHAYGQTAKQFGAALFINHGILPEGYKEKNMTESETVQNFFSVLRWNGNHFYINSDDTTAAEERKINFNAYKHQPIEKHVKFIANIIEHTYRQETAQYGEVNSLDLYRYTKPLLGEPLETKYNRGFVTHKYKVTDKLSIEKVQDVFAEMDPQLKKRLNIREESVEENGKVNKYILYDIPETWGAREKIMAFLKKMNSEEGKTARAHIIAQQIAREKANNK